MSPKNQKVVLILTAGKHAIGSTLTRKEKPNEISFTSGLSDIRAAGAITTVEGPAPVGSSP